MTEADLQKALERRRKAFIACCLAMAEPAQQPAPLPPRWVPPTEPLPGTFEDQPLPPPTKPSAFDVAAVEKRIRIANGAQASGQQDTADYIRQKLAEELPVALREIERLTAHAEAVERQLERARDQLGGAGVSYQDEQRAERPLADMLGGFIRRCVVAERQLANRTKTLEITVARHDRAEQQLIVADRSVRDLALELGEAQGRAANLEHDLSIWQGERDAEKENEAKALRQLAKALTTGFGADPDCKSGPLTPEDRGWRPT